MDLSLLPTDTIGEIVSSCFEIGDPVKFWRILRQVNKDWKRFADNMVKIPSNSLFQTISRSKKPKMICVESIAFLLSRSEVLLDEDPSIFSYPRSSLRCAFENKNDEAVRLLLKDPRLDPVSILPFLEQQVVETVRDGSPKLLKILLEEPRIEWKEENRSQFSSLVKKQLYQKQWRNPSVNQLKAFGILLSHPYFDSSNIISYIAPRRGKKLTQLLLKHPSVDPTEDYNSIIKYFNNVSLENVAAFLNDPRFDPTIDNNDALRNAVRAAELEVCKLLLKDPRVDPSNLKLLEEEFWTVKGSQETIMFLLNDPRIVRNATSFNSLLTFAVKQNIGVVVDRLLELEAEGSRVNYFEGLCEAIKNDAPLIFDKLLPLVDITQDEDHALLLASDFKRRYMMESIMKNPKVNPASNNNAAIRGACSGGFKDLVQLLLEDERVDPSANDNEAIQEASKDYDASVVQLLLDDERVDPSANSNSALKNACERGSIRVVQKLLKSGKVDPSTPNNSPICIAAAKGRMDIVELLLEDDRVDPNNAVFSALSSRFCHEDIALLLLKDKRSDMSKLHQDVRIWARENGVIVTKSKRQRLRR